MTTALILAAGESSRLGQPKQLLQKNGETLVHRAARMALEAGCSRVLVIEGAVDLRSAVADLPVELVTCADWKNGPGASLRAGANAAGEDKLLVLLADQHRVTAEHLRALLEAPGEIAAAHYAGALGVPARFSPKHAAVLRGLPDEGGAKSWLRENARLVTPVVMPDAEVDLDTPAQLLELQN